MDKNERMNELKRKTRRNGLVNELKLVGDFDLSYFCSPSENDIFCKSVFEHIRNINDKHQFGNDDLLGNIELSKEYLKKIIKDKITIDSSWRMFFFREREIEAVHVNLTDVHEYLEDFLKIIQFESGRADFILVTNELTHGICIERGEHFYELCEW
ncbi:MAG: hypothetical protein AB9836_11240 [Aminipila sp.]